MDQGHPGVKVANCDRVRPGSDVKVVKPRPKTARCHRQRSVRDLLRATKYPADLLQRILLTQRTGATIPKSSTRWSSWRSAKKSVWERFIVSPRSTTGTSTRRFAKQPSRKSVPTKCCANGGRRLTHGNSPADLRLPTPSYFLHLKSMPKHIPEASRDGLYLLGLLPSKEFFDKSTPVQLHRNFNNNLQLTHRIEILNNADRDRLNRSLEVASATTDRSSRRRSARRYSNITVRIGATPSGTGSRGRTAPSPGKKGLIKA